MYILRIEATIYETGFKSFMMFMLKARPTSRETGLVAYQGILFNLGYFGRYTPSPFDLSADF